MIIEMRSKSQVTIPHEIVAEGKISEGDKFEVYWKNGEIRLVPVVVYPKSYVEKLEKEADEALKALKNGTLKSYQTVEDALTSLES